MGHLAAGWWTSVGCDQPYPGLGWVRAHGPLIHGSGDFGWVRLTPFKAPKNGLKLYSRGTRELFNSAEQLEKCPEASIGEGKAREVGGNFDNSSQGLISADKIFFRLIFVKHFPLFCILKHYLSSEGMVVVMGLTVA